LELIVDTVDALERTFDHTQTVLAGVKPQQYDAPTPCTEWDVRTLMEHMVGVVAMMGAAVSGQEPQPFELAPDPASQFADIAKTAIAAWRTPGVLDKSLTAPAGEMPGHVYANINLLDTATHTWDLAKATGQPAALPDDVAIAAMEASRQVVSPELRAGRFADEIPVADAASETDKLVGFLGRTP
jgi:uncharacterized protein (TIGR03086 family)